MKISDIDIPKKMKTILIKDGFTFLRPMQKKAIETGLLSGNNLLICTPTASGKTLVAELALAKNILELKGKGIYLAPLKSLASEKFNYFKKHYESEFKVALSIGDMDSTDPYLKEYDLILSTSEKLDSLLRHQAKWLKDVKTLVVDEIHLLNDPSRGPTLEIILTLLRKLLPDIQIIGLSATIGNPEEVASWLGADLIKDNLRPVKLSKGVLFENKLTFYD